MRFGGGQDAFHRALSRRTRSESVKGGKNGPAAGKLVFLLAGLFTLANVGEPMMVASAPSVSRQTNALQKALDETAATPLRYLAIREPNHNLRPFVATSTDYPAGFEKLASALKLPTLNPGIGRSSLPDRIPVKRARLLIVDDHPIVRQGLVELLGDNDSVSVTSQAESAGEALELIRTKKFDLAVVDLSLRGLSGLELIKLVQVEAPDLPILVLSMHDELFYAERALRAGARGYIMKQEALEKINDAIQKVLSGEVYVSDTVSARMLHRFIGGSAPPPESDVEALSDRELEVFQLLGQGYGTRQISNLLHISPKTVESYRANIKTKLQLRNASELVQTAVQWVQSSRVL
ncbi:MAG TPA: response regulator transcription factor [Rhodothermales bacterium]